MHARGALEWFDDAELGRVVLPTSPLWIHGTARPKTVSSPGLGQHNAQVYGDWFGYTQQELDSLKQDGVI